MDAKATRPLGTSWLRGEPEAQPFLPQIYTDSVQRRLSVNRAARVCAESKAVLALRESWDSSRPRALEAWGRLAAGQATVVITGQQAGLLLGPRYTFHKALSAILIAQALEAETRVPCVPVFWVQDEDHDFPEVASYAWITRAGKLRHYQLSDEQPRVPVGDRQIPTSIHKVLDALEADLSGEPFADEAFALTQIWRDRSSWSEAFCETLVEVFRDEPLLVIRGRSNEMSALAQSYHHLALEEREPVETCLREQTSRIEAAGFKIQVPIVTKRFLSFYQPDGVGSPRYRFDVTPNGCLRIRDRTWTLPEILESLHKEPQRFSTSALLRPIVQDGVFPVVAQIVGPGEASYLAQLEPTRQLFGVPTPMVIPRGQARWIEPPVRRCLMAMHATADEVCGDRYAFLTRRSTISSSPERLREQVLGVLSEHLLNFGELSPVLDKARRRTFRSVQRNIDRFVGQMTRQLATQDQLAVWRLSVARTALLPKQHPQERFLGILDLVARYGSAQLKHQFKAEYQPYTHQKMEFTL
ncbi:MAG: bacillithiol biosynthesis cysteine-adding enzyme BshC [Myxococcales bacterium]|nr:bacillithiol biosynthesis cysteine-adding enzyme BshC [Myxococcales bacterium]